MHGLPGGRLSTDGRVKDVRADHVARYEWAAARLSGHVIDAGCNCGYGSAILADAGLDVTAIDVWREGLDWARAHYDRPGIEWTLGDIGDDLELHDAVVAFEVIEHLEEPARFLISARAASSVLLASVPNEDVWPWEPRLGPVHKRHYTKPQFETLLMNNGWRIARWWGQVDGQSDVEPDINGRTLVAECR